MDDILEGSAHKTLKGRSFDSVIAACPFSMQRVDTPQVGGARNPTEDELVHAKCTPLPRQPRDISVAILAHVFKVTKRSNDESQAT